MKCKTFNKLAEVALNNYYPTILIKILPIFILANEIRRKDKMPYKFLKVVVDGNCFIRAI